MRLLLAALTLSAFLISIARGEQLLPPGRYCGFISLGHVGMVVHPAQADGRFRVSTSALQNKEDWGGEVQKRLLQHTELWRNTGHLKSL